MLRICRVRKASFWGRSLLRGRDKPVDRHRPQRLSSDRAKKPKWPIFLQAVARRHILASSSPQASM